MSEIQHRVREYIDPHDDDKGLAARTRAAIGTTFTSLANRSEPELQQLIGGSGGSDELALDDLAVIRSVASTDQELAAAVALNEAQWRNYLVMIPSMNAARREVRALLSCRLTDVYAEGYDLTGRYYTGTGPASVVEDLACERAKDVFGAKFANVQALSGAPANVAVYMAFLKGGLPEFRIDRDGNATPTEGYEANPADRVLALNLADGGHLTHGLFLNFSARFFDFRHYGTDKRGFLDYDQMESMAREMKPKLILVGASAYPREYDYDRVRALCDEVGASMMVDMAHYAGLVAAGLMKNPLEHGADVVTFTTHKTLGGPRGAIILTNREDVHQKVRGALFPGLQGGAHFNNIAAIAWTLGFAKTASFRELQSLIQEDARALAESLITRGIRLSSGGTDSHLILADLRGQGFEFGPTGKELTGRQASECLERSGLIINRNSVPGDTRKPWITSGIRMGTNVLAARGMGTEEMDLVADMIYRVLTSAGNESVENYVREEVLDLTASFPLG